jgi:signal transduction histidine kinase
MVDERLVMVTGGSAVAARARRVRAVAVGELFGAAGTQATWPLVAALGSLAIVILAFVHPLAYDIPTLRAMVETAITLVALTGAWLLRARFAHTARVRDLLQLAALLMLALFELCCNALPAAVDLHAGGQFGATRVMGDLLAAAAFAAAAFTPSDRIVSDRRGKVAITATLCLAALGAAELVGFLLRDQLVIAAGNPVAGLGNATARPLTCALVIATAVLLAYAALASARRSRFSQSGASSLIASGLVLLIAARVYYFALPSVSPAWISSRDGLRLIALALLVAAAVKHELQMRARTARAAAIAERRRVAEDLHDGIAQDLAFIAAHGARMAGELGDEHPLTVAARRALAVSRGTISELSDMSSTSADDALEAIAHELRARFEIAIRVYAHPDAKLAVDAQEHVTRIAREAIANAARHGGADVVMVSLRRTSEGVSLNIRDNGQGISRCTDGETLEGFGLRSMRERAAALGGYMTVQQLKSGGTNLEVVLP